MSRFRSFPVELTKHIANITTSNISAEGYIDKEDREDYNIVIVLYAKGSNASKSFSTKISPTWIDRNQMEMLINKIKNEEPIEYYLGDAPLNEWGGGTLKFKYKPEEYMYMRIKGWDNSYIKVDLDVEVILALFENLYDTMVEYPSGLDYVTIFSDGQVIRTNKRYKEMLKEKLEI